MVPESLSTILDSSRVHPIGQTREVEILRYRVKDSIEEVSRAAVGITVFDETILHSSSG